MLIISLLQLPFLNFILLLLGGATIDNFKRKRRKSDSAVYFNPKELPVSRLKCLETAEENPHKRRKIEEKKENLGSHRCEEKEIAPIGSPDENFGKYAF